MTWLPTYLDDMLALLDVKLLTPLVDPDAPSAAGSLGPFWWCGCCSRWSAKDRNARMLLRRPEREMAAPSAAACSDSEATWREYWRTSKQAWMDSAATHATPQMRNSAEKLCTSSRDDCRSSVADSDDGPVDSHLSWILCRSPFSDSVRIAVDRSTASGESRWKACRQRSDKRAQRRSSETFASEKKKFSRHSRSPSRSW